MRDFRRKRAELQEQLESLQEALEDTNFQHKQQMTALEEKFFEEKVCNNEACSHKKNFPCNYSCDYKKKQTDV